jgi:hypothetical protein
VAGTGGGLETAAVDPDLRMNASRNQLRYPSPFFDVSQQYVPPTIKELFKWVYYYATNNSFLGPALSKIARYPVTDLILEDNNPQLVENWKMLLNSTLQIKTFLMETNLDLVTYGNAFVTIHYPSARFLKCEKCKEIFPWKMIQKKIDNLRIKIKCLKCGYDGDAIVRDVPFKSVENLRLVRINPEFIDIKYNDATGRHTYLYSIPDKLKRQIMSGDPDILEDTPQIYIDAIKQRKKIKLSGQNLFHLKRPTLAGKDMGWGMPLIAVALKDLYYFYTLRRGQECIINEHIVPFDILFPQSNGKFDPYVHSDISSWKREIERQLAARRKDPNYKAVTPFPIGFERIGGDGKALMLTPEMDFLSKTIIGSVGIPQEFVFGGSMNWTGSSISLRTLENDFLHHRSQLLQLTIWLVERLRIYMGIPTPKTIKFSDFKMADDVQKLQLLMGMASNEKLDWDSLQKELGYDPEVIRKKIEEQKLFEAKMLEMQTIRAAEAQAKAQKVQLRYQQQMQEEAVNQNAQMAEQAGQTDQVDTTTQMPPGAGGPADAAGEAQDKTIQAWAKKLSQQDPQAQAQALARLHQSNPDFAAKLKMAIAQFSIPQMPEGQPGQQKQSPKGADMRPLPTQRPPRRQGGI